MGKKKTFINIPVPKEGVAAADSDVGRLSIQPDGVECMELGFSSRGWLMCSRDPCLLQRWCFEDILWMDAGLSCLPHK